MKNFFFGQKSVCVSQSHVNQLDLICTVYDGETPVHVELAPDQDDINDWYAREMLSSAFRSSERRSNKIIRIKEREQKNGRKNIFGRVIKKSRR